MSDLAYLMRITHHLAGELDIKSALRAVKGEIDQIIDVDHLDVCLIDKDGFGNTSYEVGLSTSWSRARSLISESPVRDILTGKTDVMMTGDALADDRYVFAGAKSEPLFHHSLRSRINVAMRVLGKTVGALNCSSMKEDFYVKEDLNQVKILADILAPYFFALRAGETAKKEAIERARLETQQEGLRLGALKLTEALEAERQRIGMDLHDQTLAELTRLSRELQPSMTARNTKLLQNRFQLCIQDLRNIIDSSIPSILELFGFEEAVRSHFEGAIFSQSTIAFTFNDQTDGAVDCLPQVTQVALFRIAQEAINNTIKHANATAMSLSVKTAANEGLAIIIQDNGQFGARRKGRSGGLEHMVTRAKLIGAELAVATNKGTQITVHLPLSQTQRIENEHSVG